MSRILSSGDPSTLGSYRALSALVFGDPSPQTNFLDNKIAESLGGAEEEVLADERQMIMLLASLKEKPHEQT